MGKYIKPDLSICYGCSRFEVTANHYLCNSANNDSFQWVLANINKKEEILTSYTISKTCSFHLEQLLKEQERNSKEVKMTDEIKPFFEICKNCDFFIKEEEKDGKSLLKCRCEYGKPEDYLVIGEKTKGKDGNEKFLNNEEEIPKDCTYYIEHFYLKENQKEISNI